MPLIIFKCKIYFKKPLINKKYRLIEFKFAIIINKKIYLFLFTEIILKKVANLTK